MRLSFISYSLVRHFFKCFYSMVEPLPEQAQAERETEEIYRGLQVYFEFAPFCVIWSPCIWLHFLVSVFDNFSYY